MDFIFEFIIQFLLDFGIYLFLYFSIAGTAFYLLWKIFAKQVSHLRIQGKQKATDSQIKKEIRQSVFALLIFAMIDMFAYYLQTLGYTQMYEDINEYGLAYFFGSIFLMFLIHDTYFYWTHRAMHHKDIFKHVHKVHHESIDTTPFTAFSFHPIESIVENGISLLLIFIMPTHIFSLLIFQLLSTILNVTGHMGYELYPSNWYQIPILKYKTPSTHHNLHHSKFNGNYGLYFSFWDKWMGTEFPELETKFEEITNRKAMDAIEIKDMNMAEVNK